MPDLPGGEGTEQSDKINMLKNDGRSLEDELGATQASFCALATIDHAIVGNVHEVFRKGETYALFAPNIAGTCLGRYPTSGPPRTTRRWA